MAHGMIINKSKAQTVNGCLELGHKTMYFYSLLIQYIPHNTEWNYFIHGVMLLIKHPSN